MADRDAIEQLFADYGWPMDTREWPVLATVFTKDASFVITIQGEGEIETSDGTLLPLGPGSIVLVEDTADTNGRGHITRGKGSADRLSLFIPVPAEWQPPAP